MSNAIQQLKDRIGQSLDALTTAANGRELEIMAPQWRRADGSTEPLTRAERELVIRWKFLSTCAETMDALGMSATQVANESLALTYLQTDNEIGPVLIIPGPEKTNVIFGDGVDRPLTAAERPAVDRFLDGLDTYRRLMRGPA